MPKFDIITIGAATRDVFLRSHGIKVIRDETFSTGEAECFALGSKIDVDEIHFETGGGATNTAVGFSRQGLRTAFIGKVGGNDARGREIVHDLKAEGVNTSLVVHDRKRGTAYSVLLLTARGERTALVFRGASANFHDRDLPWPKMNTRWLYVSSLAGQFSILKNIWRQAAKRGMSIAWNPGAGELALGLDKLKPLLKQTSVLFLNNEEAATLMNLTRDQDATAFHQLRRLVGGVTVVTQGIEGSLGGDHQHAWHCGTHPLRVTSTTGAGDAFGCGFVGALIKTKGNIPKAMQFATANSESVIQHVGAKKGLLRGRQPGHPAPVSVVTL